MSATKMGTTKLTAAQRSWLRYLVHKGESAVPSGTKRVLVTRGLATVHAVAGTRGSRLRPTPAGRAAVSEARP